MDVMQAAQIIFALATVLVLLGGSAMLARKFGLMNGTIGLSKKRRLSLVEVLPIDAKRRAAIIRCDDREHLIVLNQNNATVITRDMPAPETEDLSEISKASENNNENPVNDFHAFVEKAQQKLKGAA